MRLTVLLAAAFPLFAACDESRPDSGPIRRGDAGSPLPDAHELDAGDADAGNTDISGFECLERYAFACRDENLVACDDVEDACLAAARSDNERDICTAERRACGASVYARCDLCRCTLCAGTPSDCETSECEKACNTLAREESEACNRLCYGADIDAGNRPVSQACTLDPADQCGCCQRFFAAETACDPDPCARVAELVATGTVSCS